MKIALIAVLFASALTSAAEGGKPAIPPPELVFVRGGVFTMGSKTGTNEEEPERKVALRNFLIAAKTVSRGDFLRFASATGYVTSAEREDGGYGLNPVGNYGYFLDLDVRHPGFPQSDEDPAVELSWYDAIAYCDWLSMREGLRPRYAIKGRTDLAALSGGWNLSNSTLVSIDAEADGYRLPTEAEWEYAAAGGQRAWKDHDRYDYAWEPGPISANVLDESFHRLFPDAIVIAGLDDGWPWTSPAGSFRPNILGLYDMAGNVWQWCEDSWDAKTRDGTASAGPGGRRVIKGGSWKDLLSALTLTTRAMHPAKDRSSIIGFRLARDASEGAGSSGPTSLGSGQP
ncbi:MAG TPA: SUMF1/EgtB/PvdO family nonheme iron enzyme [Rectinemataceae bacterium]|nr:SUMF1/EgtB/PvdO family nonheme iron enzyme [Rectinemataceae bacterium]